MFGEMRTETPKPAMVEASAVRQLAEVDDLLYKELLR